MSTKNHRLVNWRSLSSFFLTLSGFIILVSGIVLYIAPPGRYAYAVDWHLLGLDKGQWEAMHLLNSFFAVVFAIIHLVLNWKVLVRYLWNRTKQAYSFNREIVIATFLVGIICIGAIFSLPPFSTIVDWGDTLSEAWEVNQSNSLPDIVPLPGASTPTKVDEYAESASNELGEATEDDSDTHSADTSVRWGRYTVADICSHYNIPIQDAISRLAYYNIDATTETRIRILADRYGYAPSEIADIILGQPIGTYEESTGE